MVVYVHEELSPLHLCYGNVKSTNKEEENETQRRAELRNTLTC